MQGLGDAIKVVTDALGIEQCDDCVKRQGKLNRWFPFKTPNEPTQDDIDYLTEVFSWYKGLPIPYDKIDDIKQCEQIWLKLFKVKSGACKTCGSTYQTNYMNDLKRLWENSK